MLEELENRLCPAPIMWTGSTSEFCYNPSNWDLQREPTPEDDVLVPASVAVDRTPKISAGESKACKSLNFTGSDPAAERELIVNGTLEIASYDSVNNWNKNWALSGSGTVKVHGTFTASKGRITVREFFVGEADANGNSVFNLFENFSELRSMNVRLIGSFLNQSTTIMNVSDTNAANDLNGNVSLATTTWINVYANATVYFNHTVASDVRGGLRNGGQFRVASGGTIAREQWDSAEKMLEISTPILLRDPGGGTRPKFVVGSGTTSLFINDYDGTGGLTSLQTEYGLVRLEYGCTLKLKDPLVLNGNLLIDAVLHIVPAQVEDVEQVNLEGAVYVQKGFIWLGDITDARAFTENAWFVRLNITGWLQLGVGTVLLGINGATTNKFSSIHVSEFVIFDETSDSHLEVHTFASPPPAGRYYDVIQYASLQPIGADFSAYVFEGEVMGEGAYEHAWLPNEPGRLRLTRPTPP